MDLYVEKQCVDQIKEGNIKQFLLLFDANFPNLYRYVVRRVGEGAEAEKIVRLTFLDALGQIQATPLDVAYAVWLYSLAKPRVWEQINRSSFPEKQGLISAVESAVPGSDDEAALVRVDKMMKKLSLEEREIFRLKFFEEVSDAEVMMILSLNDGTIGAKIYRVLKRAYFLLFGESDERQGVYFGELSGLLSRVRELEKIVIQEVFKLSLRADLSGRIERREFAIESEAIEEGEERLPKEPPVEFKGSSDPAKIFVEAVREMREEEEAQRIKDQIKFEREEKVFDFVEKWRWAFVGVPGIVFMGLLAFFAVNFLDLFGTGLVKRGIATTCEIAVDFKGEFTDSEKRNVNKGISDRICGNFDVERLLITRLEDGKVQVEVDVPDWLLEYKFARKLKGLDVRKAQWRINEYERTLSSNKKSGQV